MDSLWVQRSGYIDQYWRSLVKQEKWELSCERFKWKAEKGLIDLFCSLSLAPPVAPLPETDWLTKPADRTTPLSAKLVCLRRPETKLPPTVVGTLSPL